MNLIDNTPDEIYYWLNVYKSITRAFAVIIVILIVCLYRYIQFSDIQQSRIENLEQANNSKNYMR